MAALRFLSALASLRESFGWARKVTKSQRDADPMKDRIAMARLFVILPGCPMRRPVL